jgi:hypothetical protein
MALAEMQAEDPPATRLTPEDLRGLLAASSGPLPMRALALFPDS